MTTSSHRKATSSSPQRFNDYLNCLREEFEVQSNVIWTKSLNPRRFNIYLANIKGEFELMAGDIESLRKERDGFEAKGMYFYCDNTQRSAVIQSRRKLKNSRMFATTSFVTDAAREQKLVLELSPPLSRKLRRALLLPLADLSYSPSLSQIQARHHKSPTSLSKHFVCLESVSHLSLIRQPGCLTESPISKLILYPLPYHRRSLRRSILIQVPTGQSNLTTKLKRS